MTKLYKEFEHAPNYSREHLQSHIEVIGRRYFVAKAKVAANYQPEHFAAMAEAYKDVLLLFQVPEDRL